MAAGLDARHRWRLPVLLGGVLFARGRRTVTTWLRAAGIASEFADYYYFLYSLGRKSEAVAYHLLLLVCALCRCPSGCWRPSTIRRRSRYGPQVEGFDIHQQSHAGPGRSVVSVRPYLGDAVVGLAAPAVGPRWPCRFGPSCTSGSERWSRFPSPRLKFATKLVLAARLVEWLAPIVKRAGKTLWIVVDGGYTKATVLEAAATAGVTIVGRLRKDAALATCRRPCARSASVRPTAANTVRTRSSWQRAAHRHGWQEIACTIYGQAEGQNSAKRSWPPIVRRAA